jgi:hypothetical protein
MRIWRKLSQALRRSTLNRTTNKETMMKPQKYVIAVGSKEISEQVQRALFSAGFEWCGGGQQIDNTRHFLSLNWTGGREITHGTGSAYYSKSILEDGAVLVSAQEVIENPFQLDRAEQPIKEVTMEDLEAHYGCRVKITKKTTN